MGNDLIQISGLTSRHSSSVPGAPPDPLPEPAADISARPFSAPADPPAGSTIGPTGPAEKTFYIETFGCQMNVHDSEKVAGVLMARGYRPVESHDDADLILYNTCSIREKAAQKVFSRLGVFKKQQDRAGRAGGGGNARIVGVLGCVAQQEGERIFERAPQVGLVCGSASYSKLPDLLHQIEDGNRRVSGLSLEIDECFETEMTRRDNPFRAYLTIIEGCDKACSYCVVPMTRGPERSRPAERILADCRRLADEGYTEIQLLGQNVNSYRDPRPNGLSFADLLAAVAEVYGVRRVRFTTSHPRDFTPEIVRAIESHPTLCDQVHLPVQSGSTRVLANMLRGYTRDEYMAKIDCLRGSRRPISLSTDIIVGFCAEMEEDFQQTLSLLDEVEYDQVFSFKYSPRPNTSAAGLVDSVPEEEKGRRLAVLQERQREIQLRRNRACIGQEFEVLVENYQPRLGQAVGRTTSNRVINFAGEPAWVGRYMNVRVTEAGPNSLVGIRVGDCT